jgi:tetratricopeptide (TPR) repeat protein
MPSFDDRAALLSALREQIHRLQGLGLIRPPAVSAPEYLRRLGGEGVLPAETSEALAGRYEACRFGCASPAAEEWTADLAALEDAAAALEKWPEERRTALAQRWRRRWTPSPRPAPQDRSRDNVHSSLPCPTRPLPRPTSSAGEVKDNRFSNMGVELRKQRAERGPSRFWTFVACTLVLWTVVVMAGSLWQRDRILNALLADRGGGALASYLREEAAPHDHVRAAFAGQRERSGPTNLMLLGKEYAERGNYAEAIQLYHQALERAAEYPNVEALTSAKLARVLLTADDPWYHDSLQAIRLARRAVQLRPQKWECLDTLAIAQARIGAYDEAVESARAALKFAVFNHHKEYLQQQLEILEAEAAAQAARDEAEAAAQAAHAQADALADSTEDM